MHQKALFQSPWRVLAALLLTSVAACNCGTQVRTLTPAIVVSPLSLNFGTLPVGTVSELPVNVTNNGIGPLVVSGITVAEMDDITVPAAEMFAQDCQGNARAASTTLQYGDCARFIVRFTASMVESLHTQVVIASNDPNNRTVDVDVLAAAVVEPFPQIQVCVLDSTGAQVAADCTAFTATPPFIPTLAFGTVDYGPPTVRKVRILSAGTSALLVNSVRMSSASADLSVTDPQTLPDSVAAGMSIDVDVVLTPSGSGAITGKLVALSNDTSNPEVDIPITANEDAPCLNVTPTSMNFGSLTVGQTKTLTLSVQNCGDSTYELTTLDFAPAGATMTFSLASGDPSGMLPTVPVTFNGGDVHLLALTYAPTAPSAGDSGQFSIATSYGVTQTVPVTAAAIGLPQIEVCVLDPGGAFNASACTQLSATPPVIPTLAFGTIEYEQTTVRSLRILDEGLSALSVSAINLASSTTDLTIADPTLPASLAVMGSVDVPLTLTPTGSGGVTASVTIASNDPANPQVVIPVTAQEDPPCLQVTPTSMSFGTVNIGTSQMQTLTVTNCGLSTYQLTTLNFVAAAASSTVFTLSSGDPTGTLPTVPLTFNPGDTHLLNLTYAPTMPSVAPGDSGQFNIVTSYGATQTVPVTAQAIGLPQIEVCVLDPGGAFNAAACTQLSATPQVIPTLNFGTLQYGATTVRSLRILSEGLTALSVSGVMLATSSTDLTIQDPTLPVSLAPAATVDVPLTLMPSGAGGVTGTVTIASNDPANPQVIIPVIAQETPPCLQVTPTSLNYGTLTVGTSKMQSVTIENCGESSYEITTWNWVPTVAGSTVFTVSGSLPPIPFTFAPGATHTLDLTYEPSAPTTGAGDTGEFTITTSFNSTQLVPAVGQAVAAVPTCGGTNSPDATIAVEQNGTPVSGNVLPLSTVTLSAASSTAAAGRTIGSYTWSLLSAPASSTTTIQGSGESVTLLCTLAGTYTVGLVVTDSDGCASAQTSAEIVVVPGSGLHIQLTWPQSYGNLDLHYVGPKGYFYDFPWNEGGTGSDLFYLYAAQEFNGPGNPGTQKYPYDEGVIDWGLNNTTKPDGITSDDPSLDADQLWGDGPENVSHPEPFDATYTVMVHYYCSSAWDEVASGNPAKLNVSLGNDDDCGTARGYDGNACKNYGSATPIVTIFWNGTQIWQQQQTLTAKQVWTAGTIDFTGTGTPVVTSSTAAITRSQYGCPDGN